jgi:hypothetical protein
MLPTTGSRLVADIEPHPEPPKDISIARLPITARKCKWYRIHRLKHSPLHFGTGCCFRFDAPRGEFGVCYVGKSREAAFIETFGQTTGHRFVQASELQLRGITVIRSVRPLQLVDLTGAGLAHIGADERLCSGPHLVAQRWSAALYSNRHKPDGLLYRARHDPSQLCAALFDRASSKLRVDKTMDLAGSAFESRLLDLLARYNFGLVP